MSKTQEALKLALEALQEVYWSSRSKKHDEAITTIQEALAQPEQEPVATVTSESGSPNVSMSWWHEPALPVDTKLYTSPPASKPLTDEELRAIENKINSNMRWRSSDEEGITLYPIEYYELVRAIEAAHGIKGEA